MKQNDLLFVTVSIFGLVVLYFLFTIYHNSVTSTIPEDVNIQITPITPVFDKNIIKDIKNRNSLPPVFQSKTKAASKEASSSANL